jgi:hypothetical protein
MEIPSEKVNTQRTIQNDTAVFNTIKNKEPQD